MFVFNAGTKQKTGKRTVLQSLRIVILKAVLYIMNYADTDRNDHHAYALNKVSKTGNNL